jgi:hypothetical protein
LTPGRCLEGLIQPFFDNWMKTDNGHGDKGYRFRVQNTTFGQLQYLALILR